MTTTQKVIKYAALAFAIFLIASILTGILGGLAMVSGLMDSEPVAGENQVYTLERDFEKLHIDLSAGTLVIQSGDRFALESNHRKLTVSQNNGTLTIADSQSLIHTVDYSDVKVVLTIPKDFSFAKVHIETGAGLVSIEKLSTVYLDMELGAGAVTIDDLYVHKEAEIETGAGRFTLDSGYVCGLDMEMGVGEVHMTGQFYGQLHQGVGKTTLVLTGSQEDYTLRFAKGLGDARLDGKDISDGTYGSGPGLLEIEGGIGAIEIEFE